MIYNLSWNIEKEVHSICSDNYKTIYLTFFTLQKHYSSTLPKWDMLAWCTDNNGKFYNLKGGINPLEAVNKDQQKFLICIGTWTKEINRIRSIPRS